MAAETPNTQLANTIKALQQELPKVQDKAGLLDVLDRLAQLPQPIRYHYRQRGYWCSGGLLLSLLLAILSHQLLATTALYYVAGIIAVISLVPLLLALAHNHALNKFTQKLYWKNALLDNQLTLLHQASWPDTKSWQQQFAEFNRGNHKREFKQLIAGYYTGTEHSFNYHYWHFHYVNKRTEVSTNGKGQVRTRTVYDHYDRYGLVLPFAYCRNLFITSFSISGISGERYRSDSGRFNRIFQVRASEQMQAARFLKPAIIIALEEQATALKQLNLAFSDSGMLCISFADKDLLEVKPPCGLDQLSRFRQSIEQPTTLPKLSQLLHTIHHLLRHSDTNF